MKKLVFLSLAVLFLVSGLAFAQQTGKIIVAASDKTPAAAVGDQPGTSPYFLVFDEKGKLVEALDNPFKNAVSPGASLTGSNSTSVEELAAKIADYFAGKGATAVVAGFFGPLIVDDMKAKGITPVTFKGSAQDAVKKVPQSK